MDKASLKKGTRIYYNGDMANEEGLGVIVRQITDRFGTVVDIRMDDKRFFPSIPVGMFSDKYLGHGGTRFVTEEAYMDFRQAAVDELEARLATADAERSAKKEAEIDEAGILKYAIRPFTDEVLIMMASGKVDMKELAQSECTRRLIGSSDDKLDAMLEDASREAEKRGESDVESPPARVKKEARVRQTTSQILYKDDFRGDKMYVWEGLCHSACLRPNMTDEITIYIKVPREITKREYEGGQ